MGTTNRTRIADYESAITERTQLLLRVHRSNFQIVGFTEQPSLEELVELGRKHKVPVMEDLGSGELFDLRNVGVRGEPTVAASLRAGVDIVTFSGDKLLGGPQAGLISGAPGLVTKIRAQSALPRLAGRQDVLCRAGSHAARLSARGLRRDSDAAHDAFGENGLQHRAGHMAQHLRISSPHLAVEVVEARSVLGGGSAPGTSLPSRAVAIKSADLSADRILEQLRRWETPIIARVEDNRVLLDLRTVEREQDANITAALQSIRQA